MSEPTEKIVYAEYRYKQGENRLAKATAKVDETGTAHIYEGGREAFKRVAGAWLRADIYENDWHLAVKETMERRLAEEQKNNNP